MKGLFDSSGKKFKSSNPELIPKAVTESLTSHLKDDVKKAVNETIIFHIDNNSGQSNVQNKNLDLYPIMNDDTESEVTYLKQIEEKKIEPKYSIWVSLRWQCKRSQAIWQKVNPLNKQKQNCRLMLIKNSNPLFRQSCFARNPTCKIL